jgi:hypothetical protein
MWNLPKTCLNYLNYVVLSNWGLTKGNLSLLNSTHNKKETHEQTKPAHHGWACSTHSVPLIYPANTHFKRGPDFTDQGMTPTGVLQFGPSSIAPNSSIAPRGNGRHVVIIFAD